MCSLNYYVFDFGQNIAGWPRIHVAQGEAGMNVRIRTAEVMLENTHDNRIEQSDTRTNTRKQSTRTEQNYMGGSKLMLIKKLLADVPAF